jgi:hypothetical protein
VVVTTASLTALVAAIVPFMPDVDPFTFTASYLVCCFVGTTTAVGLVLASQRVVRWWLVSMAVVGIGLLCFVLWIFWSEPATVIRWLPLPAYCLIALLSIQLTAALVIAAMSWVQHFSQSQLKSDHSGNSPANGGAN